MRDIVIAITAASYSGNKGAAAMLQSSVSQLYERYGERLNIQLMSVYPGEDRKQLPRDFIRVVPCQPARLLFIAFPLAILYFLFRWCPPIRRLLLKNGILKAYDRADCVLDEAGVSFVDSRGFVMNTYAFVCAAVPLLMGVPVIKYSQALGTFQNPWNRFLAKWILPRLRLICARGEITRENLRGIGVEKNVRLCADGAFTMPDDAGETAGVEAVCAADAFYADAAERLVGIAVSSVVEKKCAKRNIDYAGVIVDFIDALNKKGFKVLLIANAARIDSDKPRNNDLMIGDRIYAAAADKAMIRWYHEEMTPERIRCFIGKCRFLVASRFHAMIGGLERGVPVMLVGWSHKYREVLDMFELGQYAADFSDLNREGLTASFERLRADESGIRERMARHIGRVKASSRDNIRLTCEAIDEITASDRRKTSPAYARENCVGEYLAARKGYALKPEYRRHASSGGVVSALLCSLLRHGDIDGAWVTKAVFEDGRPVYKTFIATTAEEICDAASSVYMNVPILSHLDMLRRFPGRVAVVMQPCMLRAFTALLEREPALKQKVAMKIGLFCSGTCDAKATELALSKAGVSTDGASRLYYRQGLWRGASMVEYADGHSQTFSYAKNYCAYKNAYFFHKASCFHCKDHFAACSDASFGDVWLKEMKREPIKHTGCVIRTPRALDALNRAVAEGDVTLKHMSESDLLRSQKRALTFKYCACPPEARRRWNHKLAYRLAEHNRTASQKHPERVARWPQPALFLYMCFIRFLLSF